MADTIESTTGAVAAGPAAVTGSSAPRRRSALAFALAALFVGVVITVDPHGLVPSGPARWTVTAVIMGIAAFLLFLQPVRVERVTGVLWLALLAVLFVAATRGVDSLHAWIGTPDRRLGWLAWCAFPLMFLCGQALTAPRDRRVVLRGAAIAASALGVWCAFERAGWSLIDESFAGHRVGGPFAQPAYVGAAAVLLVPLAAAVAFDRSESWWWRAVGGFGAVTSAAALLLSQTRGAWLGFAVVGVLLAVRYPRVVRRRWREVAVAIVALVVLFAVTPLGGRFVDAFELGHGTTQGRFDDWKVGAQVVEHHPVLGVGPEGYRVVFPQVVSAEYVRRHGTSVFPDRAHNGVIDVAVSGGVLAGLLYAALLVVLLLAAWRALRSRDVMTIALSCAVIAYVVQQQFLFPLSEIDPLFWVVAGMLIATRIPATGSAYRVSRVIPVLVVATVALAAVFGVREVLGDRLLERAAQAPGASLLADADHATRWRPDSIRNWYAAARIAERGPALTDVDAAVKRVDQGLLRSPRDPALRLLDADLLTERAVRSGLEDDRVRARFVVSGYLADAPNEPGLWLDRAAIAHLDHDAVTERAARARAASLAPAENPLVQPGEKP